MKYIIEIAKEYEDKIRGFMILGAENSNLYLDSMAVDELEELNSDYINEHFSDLQDTAHQKGLEDAWEAARKISLMPPDEIEKVFPGAAKYNRYNLGYSGVEAIERLKAYEEKQKADDEIKVGDEVVTRGLIPGNTFLVTKVTESSVYGISNDGSWNFYNKDSAIKTGKHFDIEKILEAMRC